MGADLSIEEIFVSLFCRERFESSEHIPYFLQNFAPVSVQRAVQDEHAQALLKSAALELQRTQAKTHLSGKSSSTLGLSHFYSQNSSATSGSTAIPSSSSFIPSAAAFSSHTPKDSAFQQSSAYPQISVSGSLPTELEHGADPLFARAEGKDSSVSGQWVSALDLPPEGAQPVTPTPSLVMGIPFQQLTTAAAAAEKIAGQSTSAEASVTLASSGFAHSEHLGRCPAVAEGHACDSCPLKDEPCCRNRQLEYEPERQQGGAADRDGGAGAARAGAAGAATAGALRAIAPSERELRTHSKRNQLATLTIGAMYDFNDLCLAVRYALEEDRVRFIMSAAFRNLQQRIQVFPLDIEVSARSRLTHSFETAAYAKLCITALTERLPKLRIIVKEISACADTAALLHEIGSPPFGHFGEHVIRSWINKICKREESGDSGFAPRLNAAQIADLRAFNHHAQGLRLMHSVYRFNMTFGQISAAMRYPYTYAEWRERGCDEAVAELRTGVFLSEEELLRRIQRTNLGTKRHPLACIIEQCDDLAYTLADLEDAHDRHVLDSKDIFELFERLLEHLQNNACQTTCDECTSACTCAQGAAPNPLRRRHGAGSSLSSSSSSAHGLHPERYADNATMGALLHLHNFSDGAAGFASRRSMSSSASLAVAQGDASDDDARPDWVRHNRLLQQEESMRRAAREAAIKAAVDKARDDHASSSDIEAAARKAAWDFEQRYQAQRHYSEQRIVAGGTNAANESVVSSLPTASGQAIVTRADCINHTMAAGVGTASNLSVSWGSDFGRTTGVSSTAFGYAGFAFAAGFAAPSSGYTMHSLSTEALVGDSSALGATGAGLAAADSTATVASTISSPSMLSTLKTLEGEKGFARDERVQQKSLTAGAAKDFARIEQENLSEVLRRTIYQAYCHYKHDDFGVLSMVHDNQPTKLRTMMEELGAYNIFRLLRDCLSSYYLADIVDAIAQDEEAFFGEGVLFIPNYGNDAHKAIEFLKQYVQDHVYTDEQVESLELRGAAVLRGILESYEICLSLSAEEFQHCLRLGARRYSSSDVHVDPMCVRLLRRIPERCVQAYINLCEQHPMAEMYARLRLILDHVSGMTDSFAAHECALLTGKGELLRAL